MKNPRSLMQQLAVGFLGCAALANCALPTSGAIDEGRLRVVVSTEILADLVRQVGGDRISVKTVIPAGGDPHSFEPSPADAKLVATADVGFTNHLLLEEHALIKMFDSNIPKGSPNVSLAERAEQYGATLIPLVEGIELDTIWLGFAVRGKTVSRSDEIELRATKITGPGDMSVYLTQTLGEPEKYFTSADGIGSADVISLPPDAHTHVNWAFTKPGEYQMSLESSVKSQGTTTP
ncbi:MAG: metal ABC transporter solute-binding protein, Zn/Mn family, partial [Angustibacter sp.]